MSGTAMNIPKYIYPDGNYSTARPKDGQTFTILDGKTNTTTLWQWDELMGQWFNVTTSNSLTASNTATYAVLGRAARIKVNGRDLAGYDESPIAIEFSLKCECGSDKINSSHHSTWCPKHS